MPASFTWQDGAAGGTAMVAANFNRHALVADLGTPGTPTGDGLRATLWAYAPRVSTRKWRRALARVRAGQGDAKILSVGDSTTAGVGVAGASNQGDPRSYPYQLATLLNGGAPAASGLGIPGHAGNPDPRWTLGTGWINDGLGAGQNAAYKFLGSTFGTLTFTPGVLADRYDVYYLTSTFTSTGGASVQATGGAAVPLSVPGANALNVLTVSAGSASTSNVVTITPTAASVWIIGVEPYLSTARKVRVGNAGVGSSTTTDWVANPAGVESYGGVGLIKTYAPDLTILSLGLNESAAGDVAGYTSRMQALIAAAQLSGDVLVFPPIPNAAGMTGATTAQSQGVAAFTAACQTLGVPYIDLAGRWGDGDTANADGYLWNYEHPNERGYADIAQMLAVSLLNA